MAKKKNIFPRKKAVDYSKPLDNAKYERFCQEYTKDNNGTAAVIRAKYSKKGANSKGSQLLAIISIKKRIKYLQGKLAVKVGVDAEMLTNGFKKITFSKSKKTKDRDRLTAMENLGKHIGYYEADNEQKKTDLNELCRALDGKTRGLPND